jgi:uncharacterized coiled-coil protein SlyX
MGEEKITILEACRILHRSEKQVRRHIKTGKLQGEIGQDGKYYVIKNDVEELARHPDRMQEDKLSRRITNLEIYIAGINREIDEITKRLDSLSAHVDEIIEALYAMSEPHAAQSPPTARREPTKPLAAHSDAIAGQPPNTITLQELAERVQRNKSGLLGHLKKYDRDPEKYAQFEHIRVPVTARPGWYSRYFTEEQAERIATWIAANTNKSGD